MKVWIILGQNATSCHCNSIHPFSMTVSHGTLRVAWLPSGPRRQTLMPTLTPPTAFRLWEEPGENSNPNVCSIFVHLFINMLSGMNSGTHFQMHWPCVCVLVRSLSLLQGPTQRFTALFSIRSNFPPATFALCFVTAVVNHFNDTEHLLRGSRTNSTNCQVKRSTCLESKFLIYWQVADACVDTVSQKIIGVQKAGSAFPGTFLCLYPMFGI